MERKFESIMNPYSNESIVKAGFVSGFYIDLESQLNDQITFFLNYSQESVQEPSDLPKKRGRKKLRPFNPTKTEIMDKFWLRGFREFMKMNQHDLKPGLKDPEFWSFFLSRSGNPGKKRKYLSYSKEYKKFLASNSSFCSVFVAWMIIYGSIKVPRKNFKGNWDLYFNYLCTDLVQPCKMNTTIEEIKESMRLLALVYQKYLNYVSEQVKHMNCLMLCANE